MKTEINWMKNVGIFKGCPYKISYMAVVYCPEYHT